MEGVDTVCVCVEVERLGWGKRDNWPPIGRTSKLGLQESFSVSIFWKPTSQSMYLLLRSVCVAACVTQIQQSS